MDKSDGGDATSNQVMQQQHQMVQNLKKIGATLEFLFLLMIVMLLVYLTVFHQSKEVGLPQMIESRDKAEKVHESVSSKTTVFHKGKEAGLPQTTESFNRAEKDNESLSSKTTDGTTLELSCNLSHLESEYCVQSDGAYRWEEAFTQCHKLGMELPVIETLEEFKSLKELLFPSSPSNSSHQEEPWYWVAAKTSGAFEETVWKYANDSNTSVLDVPSSAVLQTCVNVEISGVEISNKWLNLNAVYMMQPPSEWCDGNRPTYERVPNGGLYLFFERHAWLVGPQKCTQMSQLIVSSKSRYPHLSGNVWKQWGPAKGWFANKQIGVKCVYQEIISCNNINISGVMDVLQKHYEGAYIREERNEWCDAQYPTYKHSHNGFYLYFQVDNYYWFVGPSKCLGQGFLLANTGAMNPFVPGGNFKNWLEVNAGNFTGNKKLEVVCDEPLKDVKADASFGQEGTYCIQLWKTGYYKASCEEKLPLMCEKNNSIHH